MDLFPNTSDMEGATVINACYGGTAALLNAFLWVESSGWNGRYAVVVAADIATYAAGPARPTCGAGAVAVLVGRDAPLSFADFTHRATHASHVWDFFKPNHNVEYPVVDGALSQQCYYQALEEVYERFRNKLETGTGKHFDAMTPDFFVFHAPYNKLVTKSYARLFLLDARERRRRRLADSATKSATTTTAALTQSDQEEKKMEQIADAVENQGQQDALLAPWLDLPLDQTYTDKTLEKVLQSLSQTALKEKMADSNAASVMVGNTYTASVFLGLASLVDRLASTSLATTDIASKSIVMFSYGSGALATMYHLTA
jgi:hydroxymethylglutaryl-CoA synthase